jgi:hypothetical protein
MNHRLYLRLPRWLGVVGLGFAAVIAARMVWFEQHAASTSGIVSDVHKRAGKRRDTITVQYRVADVRYETTYKRRRATEQVGDSVQVRYLPNNPSWSSAGTDVMASLGLAAGCAVIGIFALVRPSR